MNDHSTKVFNYLREQVQAKYPECFCTTSPVSSTDSKLPALYVSFTFPSEDTATADSSGEEVFTRTVCDAEAYSGTSAAEARGILSVADDAMRKCGFRRSNYTEVANADQSIRRYAIKWRCKLDKHGNAAAW